MGEHEAGDDCTLDFIDSATGQLGDVVLPANATLDAEPNTTLEIRARNFEVGGVIAANQTDVDIDLSGQLSVTGSGEIRTNLAEYNGGLCVTATAITLRGNFIRSNPLLGDDQDGGGIDLCAGARKDGKVCSMGAGMCVGGGPLILGQDILADGGWITLAGSSVTVEPAGVVEAFAPSVELPAYVEVIALQGPATISGSIDVSGLDAGVDAGAVDIYSFGGDAVVDGMIEASGKQAEYSDARLAITSDRDVYVSGQLLSNGKATQGNGGRIELISGKDRTVDVSGVAQAAAQGAGANAFDGAIEIGDFEDHYPPPGPTSEYQPCDVHVSGTLDAQGARPVQGLGSVQISYRDTLTFESSAAIHSAQGSNRSLIYCRSLGGVCVNPPVDHGALFNPSPVVAQLPWLSPCAVCGDGIPGGEEECDDGDAVNGDECDTNCTHPRCGNGRTGGPEQCDDGNAATGDTCDPNCTLPVCGNGWINPAAGEQCDDGNLVNGDGCSSLCKAEWTMFRVDSSPAGTRAYEPDVGVRLSNGEVYFVWTDSQMCPQAADRRGIRFRAFAGAKAGKVVPIIDAQIPCTNGPKYSPAAAESNYGYPVAYVGANPGFEPGGNGVWLMNLSATPSSVLIDAGIPPGRPHIARLAPGRTSESDIVTVSFVKSWAPTGSIAYKFFDLNALTTWTFPFGAGLGLFHWSPGPASPYEDDHVFNLNVFVNGGIWIGKVNPLLPFPPARVDINGSPVGRVSVSQPSPGEAINAIVVWRDLRNGNDQIMGRIVTWLAYTLGDLEFVTGELALSQGDGAKYNPVVASQPDGKFMVAWASAACGTHGVSYRRFAAGGTPLTGVVNVDQIVPGSRPQLVAIPTGGYVLTWERPDGAGGSSIYAALIGS